MTRIWPSSWPRSYGGRLLLLGLAYYLAARLSLQLALVDRVVTPIWPPTGIALVALLGFGPRVWPAITLAAFLVNVPTTPSLLAAAAISAGNTLAPLLAAYLLQTAGFRRELDRLRDALAVVLLGALLAMTVSASFGAGALWLSGAIPPDGLAATWSVWWAGDATGILVFAPLLLSLRRPRWASWRRATEAGVLFLALAAVAYFVFWSEFQNAYLVFPFLIWGAVRFGQLGASVATLLVVGMAVWAAVEEAGPFAQTTLLERMLTLQIYNAGAALTSFVLAAVMTERIKAQAGLEQSALVLEERVRDRTAELAEANRQLEGEIVQRRESEARVSERERELNAAQALAHVGSWNWDIPANRLTWSDEMYRIFGLEPQSRQLNYESFLERVHPEDRRVVDEVVRRSYETGAPFTYQRRIVRPDGSVRWIHAQGQVVMGEGGALRMFATAQDITERRRAEEQFTQFFDLSPEPMCIVGFDGYLKRVNRALEKALGWSAEELYSRPYLEFIDPEDRERASAEAQSLATTGAETVDYELRTLCKDGSYRWLRASARAVPDEQLIYSVNIDITERKRVEEALRESEETFRTVFETAAIGFAQCDPRGRFLKTNRAYQQLLGYSEEELRGMSSLEIAHPEDLGRGVKPFERMLRVASFEAEVRQRRKDGAWVWVHSSISLARDVEGRPRFVHVVAQDLTERKRAEALARAEAERARLEEIFQRAPAVIAVLQGRDHVLEFANPAFYQLVGTRAGAGRPIREAVPELESQGHLELLDRVYETGEAFVAHEELVRLDRGGLGTLEQAYLNLTYQPLRGPGGTVEGVLAHAVEVTETVRTREAVQALLERERRIAETLQRSLLPERLPEIPGVALAGRYLPGAAGLEVGGDWYDVFLLADGRVGLTIGDVVGRGLGAAAAMGQLRTAIRAYALETTSPAAVLERLGRLVQELDAPQMATLVYAVLDPETGRLCFASAGHPPPLLAAPDGAARYLEEGRSPPLGVAGGAPQEAVVVLEPGSTLLLYTDGLVEKRGGSIEDGMEALREAVAGHSGEFDSLCDEWMLQALRPEAPADDVALLALRLLPVAGDQLNLTFPAEAGVLASVRRALRQWLGGLGASPEEIHDLVLAGNEAATNVLEHAYGPGDGLLEVAATRSAERVSVTVRDYGRWRSPRGNERGRGFLLMHALVDAVEVVPSPSGTEVRLHRQLPGPQSSRPGRRAHPGPRRCEPRAPSSQSRSSASRATSTSRTPGSWRRSSSAPWATRLWGSSWISPTHVTLTAPECAFSSSSRHGSRSAVSTYASWFRKAPPFTASCCSPSSRRALRSPRPSKRR